MKDIISCVVCFILFSSFACGGFIEDKNFIMAYQYMNKNEYEKASNALENINSDYRYYQNAKDVKLLIDNRKYNKAKSILRNTIINDELLKRVAERSDFLHAQSVSKTTAAVTNANFLCALKRVHGVNSVPESNPVVHIILQNKNFSWNEIGRILSQAININVQFRKLRHIYIIDAAGYVVAEASYSVFSERYKTKYHMNPLNRSRFYQ